MLEGYVRFWMLDVENTILIYLSVHRDPGG
jgi:hypothetical protein